MKRADEVREVSRPEKNWKYLYTDTETYNIDMDIYETETGEIVAVDTDWMIL